MIKPRPPLVYIGPRRTATFKADGTHIATTIDQPAAPPEEQAANHYAKLIQRAVDYYKEHDSIDLLVEEFELQNPMLYSNEEAHSLLVAALRKELKFKRGNKKNLSIAKRDYYICKAIRDIRLWGLPIKNETNPDATACGIVADVFCMDAKAVHKVWENNKQHFELKKSPFDLQWALLKPHRLAELEWKRDGFKLQNTPAWESCWASWQSPMPPTDYQEIAERHFDQWQEAN